MLLLLELSLLLYTSVFKWTKLRQIFLKRRSFNYFDHIIFIWTHGEAEVKMFMEGLNNFLPNL